jgi:hypothetical protein
MTGLAPASWCSLIMGLALQSGCLEQKGSLQAQGALPKQGSLRQMGALAPLGSHRIHPCAIIRSLASQGALNLSGSR